MKRIFLFLVLGLVCHAGAADLPNIILTMGDDHGWEETGYNGHPYVKTPVLDEMASSGLRLDHFYAGHPSCSPTRGSVMTGRHPNRYGTFAPNWSTRPEEITVAQLLKKAGYACGHFGKWHLGPVKKSSPTSPGAMGFDEWLSHDNFFELDPVLSRNGGKPEKFMGESSEIIIDEAIRFMEKARKKGKPFFVVVWYGSPHEPYSGLPKDLALYDDLPGKHPDKKVKLTSNETGRQVQRPLGDVLRERFAEITAMDRSLGTLRNHLKKTGAFENTLHWYCGDNGTPSSGLVASPFRGQKGQMYEGGTRVPGIIEWPARIGKGRHSDVKSVTSDMLPTLCAIAGVPLPKRPLDGINLVPLIEGKMKRRPSPIYFWSYDTRREAGLKLEPYLNDDQQTGTTPLVKLSGNIATRNFKNLIHPKVTPGDLVGDRVAVDGDFKLVIRGKNVKPSSVELFDLKKDPAEKKNLAEEKPAQVKKMEEGLNQWQHSVMKSLTGADYQ